jgi:transposase
MNRYMEGGAAAEMLERRWFAAFKAASVARAECEALVEALKITQVAWNEARNRLVKLELLRDALGDELAELDGQKEEGLLEAAEPGELSAA